MAGAVGYERKRGRCGSTPEAQQEQGKSKEEALYLYFMPVSAPMQYFIGRSRAGAGQEHGRSRAGSGQKKGRSRARAGQEQGRSRAGAGAQL